MLFHRIAGIALFVLLVVLFIGCDRIFYKTVAIPIEAVDIVSISEDRPAEVRFVVGGIRGDGSAPTIQKVDAQRVGNTIFLRATGLEERRDSGGDYTQAVESTGKVIVVKALEVGDYKVATHDGRELLGLRIEKGASTIVRKAAIGDITVEIKTSEGFVLDRIEYPRRATFVVRKMGPEDITVSYPFVVREAGLEGIAVDYPGVYTAEPVQVSMRVEAYLTRYASGYCEKIVIDREPRGLMNIKIFGEVPINADYYQRFDDVPDEVYADVLARQLLFGALREYRFEAETDLGSFEAGDYRVNINGSDEVGFSIRGFSANRNIDRRKQE